MQAIRLIPIVMAIAGIGPQATTATIVAFDGFTSVIPTVNTAQDNIWNGLDTDVTLAVNGFTMQSNLPTSFALGGNPLNGTAYIDFAAGPGTNVNARGTVYAFDVNPGVYTLQYAASWGANVSQAVLDAYLYSTTATPTINHRFDWNTGNNQSLYADLSGINPTNAGSLAGVTLLFDNGVLSGAQSLAAVSAPFTVGSDDLVVFRVAGLGFGTDGTSARLSLLRLNAIPEPGALALVSGVALVSALVYSLMCGSACRRGTAAQSNS